MNERNIRERAERTAQRRVLILGVCASLTEAAARNAESPDKAAQLLAHATMLKSQMRFAKRRLDAIRASRHLRFTSQRH